MNKWLIRQHLVPLGSIIERLALSGVSMLIMAMLWFSVGRYQRYVEASTKTKLKSLESEETSEFDGLIKILGEQAIRRIKLKLCKEAILKLSKENNRSGCTKERCTE